jgi:hypothetical protein
MGKHRSVEDRMAALQAQMTALQAKANTAEIKEDLQIQEIDAEIEAAKKDALKWKRYAKESAEKVENFQARAQLWADRGQDAAEALRQHEALMSDLKDRRAARVAEIQS